MSKIPYMPPNIPLPDIPKLSEDDIENLKNLKLSDEKKAKNLFVNKNNGKLPKNLKGKRNGVPSGGAITGFRLLL